MSQFRLKFIWFGTKGIAIALNQIYMEKSLPVTEFFFWPRSDAWDDMRISLKSKSWISANDLVLILNQLTEVINFWQDNNDLPIDKFSQLKERFPYCDFVFCS
uniref:30S ribosomal protein 3, chloroplastic n=1 Tax=Lepocinclis playfairiana TaxID=1403386 RepID=A0A3G3LLI4_9EUGL|nr:putative ribosomal protein 3 [Lepocinclis playfairiana]AYQ93573.1 putative ribosomal protein 3 [Lepocinclis playfairiana]